MNFDAMVSRFIQLLGQRPLVLVWGTPMAGERSVYSLTGWCFGTGGCTPPRNPLPVEEGAYTCHRCGRPRGDGLSVHRA